LHGHVSRLLCPAAPPMRTCLTAGTRTLQATC
jgi:hypothetical protein